MRPNYSTSSIMDPHLFKYTYLYFIMHLLIFKIWLYFLHTYMHTYIWLSQYIYTISNVIHLYIHTYIHVTCFITHFLLIDEKSLIALSTKYFMPQGEGTSCKRRQDKWPSIEYYYSATKNITHEYNITYLDFRAVWNSSLLSSQYHMTI